MAQYKIVCAIKCDINLNLNYKKTIVFWDYLLYTNNNISYNKTIYMVFVFLMKNKKSLGNIYLNFITDKGDLSEK